MARLIKYANYDVIEDLLIEAGGMDSEGVQINMREVKLPPQYRENMYVQFNFGAAKNSHNIIGEVLNITNVNNRLYATILLYPNLITDIFINTYPAIGGRTGEEYAGKKSITVTGLSLNTSPNKDAAIGSVAEQVGDRITRTMMSFQPSQLQNQLEQCKFLQEPIGIDIPDRDIVKFTNI